MFESITFRNQSAAPPIDVGLLAESLLFYQQVKSDGLGLLLASQPCNRFGKTFRLGVSDVECRGCVDVYTTIYKVATRR